MRANLMPARSCCAIIGGMTKQSQRLASLKPCSSVPCHHLIILLPVLHDWQQFVLNIVKGLFNLVHIIPMLCQGRTARL